MSDQPLDQHLTLKRASVVKVLVLWMSPLLALCGLGFGLLVARSINESAPRRFVDDIARGYLATEQIVKRIENGECCSPCLDQGRYWSGISPIHVAAIKGDSTLLLAICRIASDPNVVDHEGNTALHWLCRDGAATNSDLANCVNILIDAGAGIDHQNVSGMSPIHMAASRRSHFLVAHLLHCGANPNLADHQGRTALHLACFTHDGVLPNTHPETEDDLEIVADLIAAGVHLEARDHTDKSALDLAELSGLRNCADALRKQQNK